MVTQIPGGVLAERFGGKNIFLWPMLVAAVGTLLCPLAANLHFAFLVALRVVIGLCEVHAANELLKMAGSQHRILPL